MSTTFQKLPFYKKASDLFSLFKEEPQAVFLDSSLENTLGQYSIICLNPYLTISEENGTCFCNQIPQQESFEDCLSRYLREHEEDNPTHLPLIAGAVGYLTYDYGRKFENIPSRHPKNIQMPDAFFTFYDNFIIEDIKEKKLWLTACGKTGDPRTSMSKILTKIRNCPPSPLPRRHGQTAPFRPNFEKEEYKQAIDRMISYIVQGDIYIANMTQQLQVTSKADPYLAYSYLRTHNPAPFGAYLNYGTFQILCASPERFLQVQDGIVQTRPIKGTRKRGTTPREDEALRQELEGSQKDRSELLMIVDLERNDLNHVCRPGSVKVTENFAVEAYATVFHLVSTIEGKLKKECDLTDLIRAAFPGGSITGAPKIRAMEIIDELEHDRRGLYTGSIGYLSLDGSCDLNIVIRTAVHQDGIYTLGVGGGITCESDLEFEYEETLQKAKAVLEALWQKEGEPYDNTDPR